MKKKKIIILIILILLMASWIIASGFIKRTDVYLTSYSVSEDGEEITLKVSVASSMGYIRDFLNESNKAEIMKLRFHSTFGGFNSSLGAKNEFVIPLDPNCSEIYFYTNDGFNLVLEKSPETGKWERPN